MERKESNLVHEAFTIVDISVQCRNLPKLDPLSQSDAFCVLHSIPTHTKFQQWKPKPNKKASPASTKPVPIIPRMPTSESIEVGRTEVVLDTANPDFTESFQVEYHFEEEQRFVLRVFDEDKHGNLRLDKHDYIGGTTFTLGQLMGSRGNSLILPLAQPHKGVSGGHVILRGEEVSMCRDVLKFQISCQNLKNVDGWFDKSDPFLVWSRLNQDGTTWNQVWKSQVIMDNLNPTFPPAQLKLHTLCNNDLDRPIRIRIMDWNKNGQYQDLGSVQTTVREILDRSMGGEQLVNFDIQYDKKKHGKIKTVVRGCLTVRYAQKITNPTFAEYISGGCELSLMTAIDFTASNGNPLDQSSLHYQDPSGIKLNDYQMAIQSIGAILQDYDSDKQFPLWGFGAVSHGVMSHCFQVGQAPEVYGVHGMVEAYNQAFHDGNLRLSGPTKFGPILEAARAHAMSKAHHAEALGQQSYSILLIITDGVIHDMFQTMDLLCQAASEAPLSVVIVGVGDADFSEMEALDGDTTTIRDAHGREAPRDIVQFVPFRKLALHGSQLAAETLAEIPSQLVQYFTLKGVMPMRIPSVPSFGGVAMAFASEDYFHDEEEMILSAIPPP